MLTNWNRVIKRPKNTSTERLTDAYCAKFTIINLVKTELPNAILEPADLGKDAKFPTPLTAEGEVYIFNPLSRLVNLTKGGKVEKGISETISNFLNINLCQMPWLKLKFATDMKFSESLTTFVAEETIASLDLSKVTDINIARVLLTRISKSRLALLAYTKLSQLDVK